MTRRPVVVPEVVTAELARLRELERIEALLETNFEAGLELLERFEERERMAKNGRSGVRGDRAEN